MLPQSVVQVKADPPLFPGTDLENFLLEDFARGHVFGESGEPKRFAAAVSDREALVHQPARGPVRLDHPKLGHPPLELIGQGSGHAFPVVGMDRGQKTERVRIDPVYAHLP